jgi:DNA polymerase-3 subunit delta'
LLLLAQDVRDFLPTILSRCQVIRLRPLRTSELARRLAEESGCPPGQAEYLSRFTMGSPELARELAAGTFLEDRAWVIDRMVGLERSGHFAAADELEGRLGSEKETPQVRRERLVRYLDVLALFYRDVLATALGAGETDLINRDRAAQVRGLAGELSVERLERVLEEIERTRRAVHFNANRKLLLGNLTFAVAQARAM